MATAKGAAREVKQQAAAALDNEWIERLMRFGYIARGILYVVLGVVAAGVVIGARSAPKDFTGALAELGSQPYGKFLLVLMAIGLAGYSLWGVIRAIWDPLHKGTDAKGLATRVTYLWSALTYGLLVLPTVQILQGRGTTAAQNNTTQTQDLSARLLQWPGGKWILLLIGLGIIAGGIYQIYYGYKREFARDLNLTSLRNPSRQWVLRLGEIGYAARGVIFMLIGIFMTQAAMTFDPHKAQGLDGALAMLMRQTYGPLLVGLIAAGLIAFGLYSIVSSHWARVHVP